ncbi:hypothetical protein MKD41_00245 [Lutibacter sp. A64]|uniref:hypothetical protein n=1 Tax=Lutibacter sp. A64 TaxID=2918526 RepID=UPI001F06CA9C|nr:hypothetical protein [Lutibacter sp. A64]UMB53928.1 hypothetical protein MKD41_00245 [Lutibacter sp. A64]
MKKQFLNLGKALSKTEQKEIFGGLHELTYSDGGNDCNSGSMSSGCPCLYSKPQQCSSGVCSHDSHIMGKCQ